MEFLKEKKMGYYSFDDWKLIDEYEKALGKKNQKPREKIVDKETLDKVLKSLKKDS